MCVKCEMSSKNRTYMKGGSEFKTFPCGAVSFDYNAFIFLKRKKRENMSEIKAEGLTEGGSSRLRVVECSD